jgi:hypothetical protein
MGNLRAAKNRGDFRCKDLDVTSHERLLMTNKEIWEAWIKRYGRPPSSITRWFDGHRMVIEIVDEAETLRSPLWFYEVKPSSSHP